MTTSSWVLDTQRYAPCFIPRAHERRWPTLRDAA
jgi:hypothetical protein